ncbi:uncharacterized protein LOC124939102 [Impatiens glandulifera]|uniref:uncharacterized protein LOC124939102 n=1 Tax=Impatiens glandulifera TaxID=253017 RepID=UPI001FB08D71|nr:uncharacterized protein LOC124939102 [Impatiens glandulifera]
MGDYISGEGLSNEEQDDDAIFFAMMTTSTDPMYFEDAVKNAHGEILDTIILLLDLATEKGWKVYQLDVKSAFLKEEIYVQQPEGFVVKGNEDEVYLLKKKSSHGAVSKRKISVDPISFKESSFKEGHPSLLLPRLKPGKFLSSSLPSSATSSPRISSPLKKKWKNQSPTSQPSSPSLKMIDPTTGQQSLALSRLAQLQEIQFQRSKSCGEGRNTSPNLSTRKLKTKHLRGHVESIDHNSDHPREATHKGVEKFKCGACLFLPGFGKAKLVRPHRSTEEEETIDGAGDDDDVIEKYNAKQVSSNRVSLEKFECGSWTSSAIVMDGEDGIVDVGGLFFDNVSPVANSFVFDGDLRGALKKVVVGFERDSFGVDNRKSAESGSRHVRFSNVSPRSNTASPTTICISPRLRQARDNFNAFLEAQTV